MARMARTSMRRVWSGVGCILAKLVARMARIAVNESSMLAERQLLPAKAIPNSL